MLFDKYYVIDTNIILEDFTNISKISQNGKNLIIIAETVLDELDSKKSGFEEINFQARNFARMLDGAIIDKSIEINSHKIVNLKISTINIQIISKTDYNVSKNNTSLNIYNDRKILEIADFANLYYDNKIEFLSNDIMARVRATSLDLKTSALIGDGVDDTALEFHKNIIIKFQDLEKLHGENIYAIDKDYKAYNFSYTFHIENSDQDILCSIKNEKIYVLDEVDLREQIVTPLNQEQLFFSNAMLDLHYNVIISEAKAGSGKTLLALSSAIKMVRKKHFSRIIYIRNSIESLDKGEDIGYLPGYEEKFAIYNHPLQDSLRFMARLEHKRKNSNKKQYIAMSDDEINEKISQTIVNYNIETMWVGEMRGRTLSEAFVIIDEAQNMSNKTMQMVLSRLDTTCKVVILGSNKQIDNFYVNKYTNALTTLIKSTKNKTDDINIFAIKLKKVLRGPITKWAENIFE
jgi:PhoH-like ATPase